MQYVKYARETPDSDISSVEREKCSYPELLFVGIFPQIPTFFTLCIWNVFLVSLRNVSEHFHVKYRNFSGCRKFMKTHSTLLQSFHTRKLGEITVFYALRVTASVNSINFKHCVKNVQIRSFFWSVFF